MDDFVRVPLQRSFDEVFEAMKDAPAPTTDDVTILKDGRRLDTPEKVIAWVWEREAEKHAERQARDS